MTKFNVGDRVRGSHSFFNRHGDATVIRPTSTGYTRVRHSDGYEDGYDGGTLQLIIKGGADMARKTYKQIKETVDTKVGSIWQEACDDGTQEYILITPELQKGRQTSPCYPDRSLVEDQPQWFVEVFPVEPQYMTAGELEQWKAFQGVAKSKKTKTAARKATPAKKSA